MENFVTALMSVLAIYLLIHWLKTHPGTHASTRRYTVYEYRETEREPRIRHAANAHYLHKKHVETSREDSKANLPP